VYLKEQLQNLLEEFKLLKGAYDAANEQIVSTELEVHLDIDLAERQSDARGQEGAGIAREGAVGYLGGACSALAVQGGENHAGAPELVADLVGHALGQEQRGAQAVGG
jgi:hypothetical protein